MVTTECDISIHELSGMDRVLLAHMLEIASPHVGEKFLESLVRSLGTLFGARTTFTNIAYAGCPSLCELAEGSILL